MSRSYALYYTAFSTTPFGIRYSYEICNKIRFFKCPSPGITASITVSVIKHHRRQGQNLSFEPCVIRVRWYLLFSNRFSMMWWSFQTTFCLISRVRPFSMPIVTEIRFDSVNIFGYGPCIYSDCFVFSVHSRRTVRGGFSRYSLCGRKFKSDTVLQTLVEKII